MNNRNNLIWCVSILMFLILACNDDNKNKITTNSVSKEQNQTETSEQKPVENLYESGGIGLSRTEWENLSGIANENSPLAPIYYSYKDGKYTVQFAPPKSGNVRYIEYSWGDKNAVNIKDAREESKKFIPKDAKFKKTYVSISESIVDLYESKSLKNRFSKDYFFDSELGEFIIIYRNQTGKTTSFIIATGNNP